MGSTFPKFYKLSREERLKTLKEKNIISQEDYDLFLNNSLLDLDVADSLIENQLTQFHLPLGVALNMKINQNDYVVPMVVEEPSVIAACSNAAKLTLPEGFKTTVHNREMIGQVILKNVAEPELAAKKVLDNFNKINEAAKQAHPSIVSRGGGLKRITHSIFSDPETSEVYLTFYLIIDVKDAMGANIINTILEGVTPLILSLTNGASLMSILSNYNTEALVTATCRVPIKILGIDIATKITEASRYAKLDTYRAVTHNKGIMNGVDSVIIATGNDPRAVSAACHAYASRNGHYQGMSSWSIVDNYLIGELTLPMALGTVGGAISVLPMAKSTLNILDVASAKELGEVAVATGLAQNLAALKALVSEGIQKGHMKLHASSLAIQVGAQNDEIEYVTEKLRSAPKMNSEHAIKFLEEYRHKKSRR